MLNGFVDIYQVRRTADICGEAFTLLECAC
jgi:hypothetical protein